MILKIYLIGFITLIIWWGLLALLVFEKHIYDKMGVAGKKAADEINEVINLYAPNNPQLAYIAFSLIISILWPPILLYSLIKKIFS